MRRTKSIRIIIISSIILLLTAGAAAIGNKWFETGKKPGAGKTEKYETINVMDESGIGEPTGDDPWMEMQKLVEAYYGGEQLITYHGRMRLIDDNHDKQKLLEELSFEYSSYGEEYYYRMEQLECVKKRDFIMMADHDNRSVSISYVSLAKDKNNGILSMEDLKKMLQERSKEIKITQSGDTKILTVNDIQDPSIQGYQVFYDPVTYQVKKMVLGMIRLNPLDENDRVALNETEKTSPDKDSEEMEIEAYAYRLEILYDKIEKTRISEQEFRPEQKFIRFNNNKPELQPAFSDYRLLN
jgi:hypothetical protein